MAADRPRPFARLLLALVALVPLSAGARQEEPLGMLREFRRQSLGLMDVSADGRLLLHQYLRERSRATGARLERLHVIDEPSGREIATLTLESAQPRAMLFLPSGSQVLVSGQSVEPAAARGFLLWDPDSGKLRVLRGLEPAGFTFIQFLDATHLLGQSPADMTNNAYAVYNLSSEVTAPFDIRQGERYDSSMWERGLTLSPDRKVIVGRDRAGLTFRRIGTDAPERKLTTGSGRVRASLYSPDGTRFVVISEAAGASEVESTVSVSVYEAETLERVRHQPILTGEAAGSRGLAHVGHQVGISPDGRWLVVGYDRLTTQFVFFDHSQAKYAVYELRSGRFLGAVSHPPVKIGADWAAVSSAQSGRLRFSPDGRSFYTTSEFTRQWRLPRE